MRNASGHQCKVKMSGSEKKSQRHFLHKTCKKFLHVLRCSRAKQRQRNVQKVCCMCKAAFLLIRPVVLFTVLRRCLRRLAEHDFEQTVNIIESFAFSPG